MNRRLLIILLVLLGLVALAPLARQLLEDPAAPAAAPTEDGGPTAAGASPGARPARRTAVSGQVVDQLGTPVAGVAVAAGPDDGRARLEPVANQDRAVRTGADGRFQIDVAAAVPVSVIAHHPHFAPILAARMLRVPRDTVHDLGEIILPAHPGLLVEVRAAQAQRPVSEAVVTARRTAIRADFPAFGAPADERTATSDGNGIATLYGVGGGGWIIRVTAGGYATTEQPHQQPAAPPQAPRLVVALPRGLELTGRVTDAAGLAVAGATVRCRPEAGDDANAIGLHVETGPQGRFRLRGLTAQPYRVTVESYDHGTLTREAVDPAAGFLELQLAAGHEVRGHVLDDVHRQGVDGAKVVLEFGAGWPILRQGRIFRPETRTDAAGFFRFRGIPAGRITLIASSEGRTPVRLGPFQSPAQPVTLLIQDGFRVTGKILSPAGLPLENAVIQTVYQRRNTIQPSGLSDRIVPGRSPLPAGRSAGGGRFELLGIPAGRYRVLVRAEGLPPALSEPFTAAAGMHRDLGAIQTRRGAAVSGIALDSNGQPAAGATIYLDPQTNLGSAIGGAKAISDRRGHFRLPAVAPGQYRMFYDYPDQETPRGAATTRARTGVTLHLEDGQAVHRELKPKVR